VELISRALAWIATNEAALSGVAAAIVIIGVLLSPLRRRFSKSVARDGVSGASEPRDARQPIVSLAPVTDRPSIAVLPFQNLSGDPEHEYLADGLSEDIITGLSRVKQFFVIARNTSFTYKGRAVDVQEVSRDLGVRYVLEGSVRAVGDRIRVTAQLIDATTRAHAWAERYDRPLADILAVDDEVTDAIVAALQPALRRAEIEVSRRADAGDLGAWALVNRAWYSIQSDLGDDPKVRAAAVACEEAIVLDPDYGLAHAVLAHARSLSTDMDAAQETDDVMLPMQRALELAPDDPGVQHAYAAVLGNLGRTGDAIRAWERSLELNPNNAGARAGLGIAQVYQKRHSDAVENMDTALRLSPSDPLLYHWLAHRALACAMLSRWDEALDNAADSVHRTGSRVGWAAYAGALAHAGRLAEAGEAWRKVVDQTPGISPAVLVGYLRGIAVDEVTADAMLDNLRLASEAASAASS
jgi:adenylate cyclase